MSGWLTVIGLGEEGPDALAPAARVLIEQAEVLVGGERHLAMIPDGHARRMTWRRPLADTMDDIRAVEGQRVVVLATGDPFCFGIGTMLRRAFPEEEMVTIPAPSAFSLARARLGWSVDETVGVTLHGRPLETIRAYLAPGQRLLVLSHDGATPAAVAAQLTEAGYGASTLTVFSHMGGAGEACVSERAEQLARGPGAGPQHHRRRVPHRGQGKALSRRARPAGPRVRERRPAHQARDPGTDRERAGPAARRPALGRGRGRRIGRDRVAARRAHLHRHRGRARRRPLRPDRPQRRGPRRAAPQGPARRGAGGAGAPAGAGR